MVRRSVEAQSVVAVVAVAVKEEEDSFVVCLSEVEQSAAVLLWLQFQLILISLVWHTLISLARRRSF